MKYTAEELKIMGDDKKIEVIIRAISAKDATAAGMYHALSAGARQKVLKALSADGFKSLTSLIKSTKKRSFAAANKRFLEIAQGTIATPVYLIDETLIEENMRVLQVCKRPHGVQDIPRLEGICVLRHVSHDEQIPGRNMCKWSQ